MNYLKVSIIEDPTIVYEIHEDSGAVIFTDALGGIIPTPAIAHYTSREGVTVFEPWMQLPIVAPISASMDKIYFLQRFTQAERIAIRTAAKSSAALEDFLELLNATTTVNTNDPLTIAGLHTFEQVGLLAVGRANQILGV